MEKITGRIKKILVALFLILCLIAFSASSCTAQLTANPMNNSGYVAPPVHCESGYIIHP